MNLSQFRARILDLIKPIKSAQSDAHLHLIYTPELHHPLTDASDDRRETAVIESPHHLPALQAETPALPRLITLDVQCVAPYLLEHDVGLDDPLFEASIAQAHAESFLGAQADAQATNDEPALATRSVAGWVVGHQSAKALAQRIAHFSAAWMRDSGQRGWVRWTQPQVMHTLWLMLRPEQRQALLGDAVWFMPERTGLVQAYAARALTEQEQERQTPPALTVPQEIALRNIPLVQELYERCQQMAAKTQQAPAQNLEQTLHTLTHQAQTLGMSTESVALYALTAVQLQSRATQDPRWLEAIENAKREARSLAWAWGELPPTFWQEYALTPA